MKRKITKTVHVRGVPIGGGNPIPVQSMTNTHTDDVAATLAQLRRLQSAGCEIVRLAVPNRLAARALPEIRREDIPDLARYAHREANPLYPVPVLWDAGQLEMFYYKVMEGGGELDRAGDPAGRGTAAGMVSKRAHPAC